MRTGLFVGLATLDVVQHVETHPGPNQKMVARESWLAAGGPATVAAIAFAALGGRARLLTVLGTGPAAAVVRADLAGAGVEVLDAAPDGFDLAPSVALVASASGDRTVVSGSGHRPETILVPELDLDGIDVVLVDGHHPELPRAVVRAATAAGVSVVVDAGSHKAVFDELWASVTDVICSADYLDPSGDPPEALLRRGPELVAVSHGGAPLQWWTAGTAGELAVPAAQVVDTLSAGDVMHGAYAFALASQAPGSGPEAEAQPIRAAAQERRIDALRFAIAVASRRVTTLGPFAWRADLKGWAAQVAPSVKTE